MGFITKLYVCGAMIVEIIGISYPCLLNNVIVIIILLEYIQTLTSIHCLSTLTNTTIWQKAMERYVTTFILLNTNNHRRLREHSVHQAQHLPDVHMERSIILLPISTNFLYRWSWYPVLSIPNISLEVANVNALNTL